MSDDTTAMLTDQTKLIDALALARNRLQSHAVDAIARGDPRSIEFGEWADAANAALQSPVAAVSDGVREAGLIRLLDEAIHLISVGEENHGDEERWFKQAKMAAGWEGKN